MIVTIIGSLLALILIGTAACMIQRESGRRRRAEKLHADVNAKRATDLIELQRMAESLRAKDEEFNAFASTLSHDLRAPLRGIAGYAQELDRSHQTGLSERGRFCVNQILTATHNLDSLIENLLCYSRLDAESPSFAEVNVTNLIDGILKNHMSEINERGVETKVAIPFE